MRDYEISLTMLSLSVFAAGLSGCLYTNLRSPWAYRAATPVEVKSAPDDPVVTGKSCDFIVMYMVAWGDSGYRAAVNDALKNHPGGILYDVKTDAHVDAYVLGLYTHACTEVTGRVGHL